MLHVLKQPLRSQADVFLAGGNGVNSTVLFGDPVLVFTASRSLATAADRRVVGSAAGDLNGDGFDDVAAMMEEVTAGTPRPNQFFFGGAEAITPLTGPGPAGALAGLSALGDFNGDGYIVRALVLIAPFLSLSLSLSANSHGLEPKSLSPLEEVCAMVLGHALSAAAAAQDVFKVAPLTVYYWDVSSIYDSGVGGNLMPALTTSSGSTGVGPPLVGDWNGDGLVRFLDPPLPPCHPALQHTPTAPWQLRRHHCRLLRHSARRMTCSS